MRQAIAPGTLVHHYQVDSLVGSGSMGDVYRALDTNLNRFVALKILSPKHRDNEELRARFVREGRAVAAISHPNVVQVFATGSFDERPYIAMEFLSGIDLGTLVKRDGPCNGHQAARAVHDAALGLQAAAAAGVIHRDVKPTNLIKLETGSVKVTDFGLAKPIDPKSEPALTAMGVVVGTPDFIAPEQARGETLDERVDIYGLGGTLYFLLTGSPPYRTGNPGEDKYLKVVSRHLRAPVPVAIQRNPNADPRLTALSQRMMAKKPSARPAYAEIIGEAQIVIGSHQNPGRAESQPYGFLPQAMMTADGTEPFAVQPALPSIPTNYSQQQGKGSKLLIILTLLSALFFLTGLVLFLLRA